MVLHHHDDDVLDLRQRVGAFGQRRVRPAIPVCGSPSDGRRRGKGDAGIAAAARGGHGSGRLSTTTSNRSAPRSRRPPGSPFPSTRAARDRPKEFFGSCRRPFGFMHTNGLHAILMGRSPLRPKFPGARLRRARASLGGSAAAPMGRSRSYGALARARLRFRVRSGRG